jgi:triosephosphate isomerase
MLQRQRLIVGNWKMHKTIREARAYVERLAGLLRQEIPHSSPGKVQIILAPPFTALAAVYAAIGSLPFLLAAQDLYWEDEGAFTGEVSAPMLRDAGCRYVIVGHSERRRYFAETDATVQKKLASVLRHGLRPILCVGETWDQHLSGHTEWVLSTQLREALAGVEKNQAAEVVIAYEPVWAIGSGRPATPQQSHEAHRHIRTQLIGHWGQDAGVQVPILYGGSVNAENIGSFLGTPDVDGALVGGACLDPWHFAKILAISEGS